MSRLHVPTLSNLEEDEEEDTSFTASFAVAPSQLRQHSYPLVSHASTSTATNVKRHKLKSAFTSPGALITGSSNVPSGSMSRDSPSNASRSDIYTQFMRRYRRGFSNDDSSRLGDGDDHGSHHGLLAHWDVAESDDEEPESLGWLTSHSPSDTASASSSVYDEEVQPKTSEDRERLEWQAMLTSVMDGDVLKTEKSRIAKSLDPLAIDRHNDRYKDLWLELRANLAGISTKEEARLLEEQRQRYVDNVIHDILEFRVRTEPEPGQSEHLTPLSQVILILRRLDAIEDLYPTLRSLYNDKPICLEEDFNVRRDALASWANIASSIKHQVSSFQKWTGSASLDVAETLEETPPPRANGSANKQQKDSSTFVERVLKEDSLQRMFEKKTLTTLHHFLISTKNDLANNADSFQRLNLPGFEQELAQLVSFPLRLVEAILKMRLEYAKEVIEFDLLIVEQMIDDFRIAIGLACTLRVEYEFHFTPDENRGWTVPFCISNEYDSIILQAVKFLFQFIHQKMKLIPLEDADIMAHSALFDEISLILVDGSTVVAEQLCSLTTKFVLRVMSEFDKEVREPLTKRPRKLSQRNGVKRIESKRYQPKGPLRSGGTETRETGGEHLKSWYSRVLDDIRLPVRRLMRFTRVLGSRFRNATEYSLENISTENFINKLVMTGHLLVYTHSIEDDGVYVIAHPSLKDRPETIQAILTKAYHVDPTLYDHSYHDHGENAEQAPSSQEPVAQSEDWDGVAYILLLTPTDRFLWSGDVLMQEMSLTNLTVKEQRVRLIANGPHTQLDTAKRKFVELFDTEEEEESVFLDGHFQCVEDEIAHLEPVEKELRRMAKSITRMAETVVRSLDHVHLSLRKAPNSQELLEGWFLFVSELGQQAMRYISPSSRISFNGMLTRLAITWVAFICDECDHKDRKIFRWAINALEFALFRTRRNNILYLPKDQFELLRQKVASCMTLLMSHFDILGAKSSMEAKKQKLRLQELRREQALQNRGNKDMDHGTLSRPQSPDSSRSGIYGALNAVYERKSRLSQDAVLEAIQDIDHHRHAVDAEQHIVGRVLDVGIPEDRSLVDLVSSASHVSIRWQQGRFIGAGAFGAVYQAFNLSTGSVMAVKEIRYQEITGSNLLKQIKDELAVMEMLHHPNIVEFYGIEAHRDKVYIFEEFCQGGSLGKLLEHGRIEDEGIVQVYSMQMLDGLAYLHSQGIIHRDLKPDNILLDHLGDIKIVDFGAAKVLAKTQKTLMRSRAGSTIAGAAIPGFGVGNTLTGTPMYMSPEVIRSETRGPQEAVDVWSLGCVILECVTGKKPWSNLDNEWAIMFHIGIATQHPPLPDPSQLSVEGIDFIRWCLTLDPVTRPTAQQLLDHKWINDFREKLNLAYNIEEENSSQALSTTNSSLDNIQISQPRLANKTSLSDLSPLEILASSPP